MTGTAAIAGALAGHWRRHKVQLAALIVGLAAATALWSGVQALNTHARASYRAAEDSFSRSRVPVLAPPDGGTVTDAVFARLRRAGWAVAPVLEGRLTVDGRSYTLVGIDPLSLPDSQRLPGGQGFDAVAAYGDDFLRFVSRPGLLYAAPATARALAAGTGRPVGPKDHPLPPIAAGDGIAGDTLIADIGVAQALLGQPGRLSYLILDPDSGHRRGAAMDTAQDSLNAQDDLNAQDNLNAQDSLAGILAGLPGAALVRVDPAVTVDISGLTDSFHLNLTAFGLLSFLVGLFIVHATIGLAFEQRLPTYRTLRACGVSARRLTALLLTELLTIALAAGAVGVALGYGLAAALLPDVAGSLGGLYGAAVDGSLRVRPSWWLAGLGMSLAGALAASAGALWRVYRLPLLAAAHPRAWHDAQARRLTVQTLAAGALLLAAVAVYRYGTGLVAGFAVMGGVLLGAALALPGLLSLMLTAGGALARRPLAQWFWADMRQQLSGLSLALMALLLALATNIGVGTMVDGFRKTFAVFLDERLVTEVYVDARDNGEGDRIAAWLAARADVDAVLPNWSVAGAYRGWPADIYGFRDHATYRDLWTLLDAVEGPWDRVRDGAGALVSEQLARRFDIRAGDDITLDSPAGPWTVAVAGIYADYGNPRGQVRVAAATLTQRFPNARRTQYGVRTQQTDRVIAALKTRFALDDRRVIDQTRLKRFSNGVFERTFTVTVALKTLTLGVAGIALLTALMTLTGARLPQIAPIWALGVPRRTLVRLELAKILALALLTAGLAVPLGTFVAWCLVALVNVEAFGWRLPLYVFPMKWLDMAAVAALTAGLAAALPLAALRRMPPARLAKVFADER
ncbi:FtsX-like permease family protein [Eilatimonas milleporae]|uniref:Putative ABC transport system permease protein n=1 Tax=Eilatimonas milleporae TaxID=911205 RepID=A0A3M0CEX6_9PROT|nr:FtsX-like permease family protein [Eilatimonas milleporae]RMB07952.1 putative ABC transport system permease protein [Eilatimonas milleporae]